MPVFDLDEIIESPGVDWALLQNSSVHLYWRQATLFVAVAWLADHGYKVITLDAGSWGGRDEMLAAMASAFEFPDYFGKNFDALNDCLSDVAEFAYGSSREASGTVLVLMGFDRFAGRDAPGSNALLDIWATQARRGLLFGHRMMCLLQSDDPDIRFDPVGASPVMWNPAEWLDKRRKADD